MSAPIKVVAVNGSPHGVGGNTGQMLEMIATHLSEEGIDLEEINLAERSIEYCVGCALCLEKSGCWRNDDQREIIGKLLDADGIILAAPVYFGHVPAQMKAFIDRSLGYGHKPRNSWKPGLAVSVSAGKGETETGRYLANLLRVYGAFSVGTLTAIAILPGHFLGKAAVESRARDLALDLARAIREKREYPVTDEHLSYYLFMRDLVTREKGLMEDDYRHWRETGLIDSFEAYVKQKFTSTDLDTPEMRQEWRGEMIREEQAKKKARSLGMGREAKSTGTASGKPSAESCHELLRNMPATFRSEEAKGFKAVYQFEITGAEEFAAYLQIVEGRCEFHEGCHGEPDVIITSPADVWLAVSRKEMSGQAAFMSGKYKAKGDIALLMKLNRLFG
jgi:multimeric flavodoxin WrbA